MRPAVIAVDAKNALVFVGDKSGRNRSRKEDRTKDHHSHDTDRQDPTTNKSRET